jgi:hypothetical protein
MHDLTPERIRKIHENADLATCCLVMVGIHVTMATGHKFITHAFPWEALDAAENLRKAGATDLAVWPGRGGDSHTYWMWSKPRRAARHLRRLAQAGAMCAPDALAEAEAALAAREEKGAVEDKAPEGESGDVVRCPTCDAVSA